MEKLRRGCLMVAFAITCFIATLVQIPSARAVLVSATGTNASACDQVVNDSTGVTASRLAGGDCLVKFSSTSISYQWTSPATLFSITYLVVGGGGSGGTGWDSTGAGGGGGGMVLSGSLGILENNTYSISVGGGGAQSVNARTYNNGNAGSSSSLGGVVALGGGFGYTSRANSGVAQAGGFAQNGTGVAPTGGSGPPGGSAGGGGGGANTAGGSGTGNTAGSGGAGISNSITDSAIVYGAGGQGGTSPGSSVTGAAGGANTGKGGGGGSGAGSSSASGGAGGSGVVFIRYSTSAPTINYFLLTGSPLTAIYRASTSIELSVTVSSKVTFLSNGKRIPGCVSLNTGGSGTSFISSCAWKPAIKGPMTLTALVKPITPGFSNITSSIQISVIARASKR